MCHLAPVLEFFQFTQGCPWYSQISFSAHGLDTLSNNTYETEVVGTEAAKQQQQKQTSPEPPTDLCFNTQQKP